MAFEAHDNYNNDNRNRKNRYEISGFYIGSVQKSALFYLCLRNERC